MNRQMQGFTLIEVLISVLILSLGLLGVAAMQSRSLGSSHTASLRSQAILAAGDIADRMRANRVAADPTAASNYGNIAGAENSCRRVHYGHVHGAVLCSTSQLAADDLRDWRLQLAGVLPTGRGIVCIDSTPDDGTFAAPACDAIGNTYAVKIFWQEKSDITGAATTPQRFVTQVQP